MLHIEDLKGKYDNIPESERSGAHTGFLTCKLMMFWYLQNLTSNSIFPIPCFGPSSHRFIGKLQLKITELDNLHAEINDIYSAGAVEGYVSS